MQIRIIDHGPGVALPDRDLMFAPFQRLGDIPGRSGVGLGLAVARGLAEAVGAAVEVDDTPGGGLTMIVTVPVSAAEAELPPVVQELIPNSTRNTRHPVASAGPAAKEAR